MKKLGCARGLSLDVFYHAACFWLEAFQEEWILPLQGVDLQVFLKGLQRGGDGTLKCLCTRLGASETVALLDAHFSNDDNGGLWVMVSILITVHFHVAFIHIICLQVNDLILLDMVIQTHYIKDVKDQVLLRQTGLQGMHHIDLYIHDTLALQ